MPTFRFRFDRRCGRPFISTKRGHQQLHPHIGPPDLEFQPRNVGTSTRAIFGFSHWQLSLHPQDSTNLEERSGVRLPERIDPGEVTVQ